MTDKLREFVNKVLPEIDDVLTEQGYAIPKRFIEASLLFVEIYVDRTNFGTKEEFLESEAYRDCFLPIFSDWYYEKYGDLTRKPIDNIYSGIVIAYSQPIKIKFPSTTSTVVEEGKIAKMNFPDHLQDSEAIEEIIQPKFDLGRLRETELQELTDQIRNIVGLTRTINIDINMAVNISKRACDMSGGIWSHFEKGISDILTLKSERAAIACWELHLAMEKALKVVINSKTGKIKHGHDLYSLALYLSECGTSIDTSGLSELPSDKEAIQLRYAERVKQPIEAYKYYIVALNFVATVVGKLDYEFGIKNASITFKKPAWAR